MMEEGEASAEMKRLRNDLATMIGHFEVSFENPSIVSLEDHSLLTPCSLQNVMKVSEQCWRQLKEMAPMLEENKNPHASVNDLQAVLLEQRHRREDLEVKVLALEMEHQ